MTERGSRLESGQQAVQGCGKQDYPVGQLLLSSRQLWPWMNAGQDARSPDSPEKPEIWTFM